MVMGMVELINAELRCLPWGEVSSHTAQDIADHLAENDVVQVVRCKDCKLALVWVDSKQLVCTKSVNWRAVEPDHFCSYGERKDDHE
jgi:hypothetical protein